MQLCIYAFMQFYNFTDCLFFKDETDAGMGGAVGFWLIKLKIIKKLSTTIAISKIIRNFAENLSITCSNKPSKI